MKIKFKNAAIIWTVVALAIVGKDIVAEHTDILEAGPIKASVNSEYPFIVDVWPKDARVKIMNIGPKYSKGMILPVGKYDIKVTKYGYKSERVWIKHAGDKPHIIRLIKRD